MIQLVQLVVFGFIGLSVVYLLVTVYSRSVRREKLEKQHDAGQGDGTREDFVARGMIAYEKGLRRKLIVLVYIVPMAVVALTVYLVNWQ